MQLEIEEIPTQAPLQLNEAEPKPVRLAAGRRRIAGVPRRGQGRPGPQQGERAETVRGDDDTPRGRPREGVKQEPVGTLEKYSHNNADGSFTFGYVGADGSFREETRGVDCITRGKYGYIDPDGVKREYSYTSGLPCSVGENGEQNLDIDGNAVVEDPVDPRERFRQTSSVQLDEVDIPEEAKRQRVRPEDRPQEDPNLGQTAFTNFGAQPAQRRPAQPSRNSGSALDNLLNFADDRPTAPAAAPVTPRPFPQRTVTNQGPTARPAVPANPGSFDFDSELEGFTLNRPSLTFEQNRAQEAPTSQFQSQLVFDQNTGTFQTELRQNIVGGGQVNLQNNAAPFAATTPSSTTLEDDDLVLTTLAGSSPSPRPTTFFSTQQTSLAPSPTPASARAPVLPAGTFKLDFAPLNIPQASIAPASPTPAVARLPSPTSAAPGASPPTPSGAPPANTFFVFSPFNQQGAAAPSPRPASQPFPAPLNPNAFQIQPVQNSAPNAAPAQLFPQRVQGSPAPARTTSSAPAPQAFFQGFPGSPAPLQSSRPLAPGQPNQPFFLGSQPQPAPQASPAPQAAPTRPQSAPSTPQIQFGFQPVQQQQFQNAPFTAFRSGTPPQIQAAFQSTQSQPRPQQLGANPPFQGAPQLGVPPQLQGAQQPNRFAPQNSFFPGQSQIRPAAFNPGAPGPQQGFSIFNGGQQLRGA